MTPKVIQSRRLISGGFSRTFVFNFSDEIYRYDLESEEAREILKDALKLKTYSSLERAARSADVVKVLDKKGDEGGGVSYNHSVDLGLVKFSRNHGRSKKDVWLTTAGGRRRVLQNVMTNSKSVRWIWGGSERKENTLTVTTEGKLGTFLSAEAVIDDTRTTRKEYNEYSLLASLITGVPNLLPPPLDTKSLYGRTYIYFGYHLEVKDLQALSLVSAEEWDKSVKAALEALDVRSTLHAKIRKSLNKAYQFLSKWSLFSSQSLDQEDATKSSHSSLVSFLDSHRFKNYLLCAVRIALSEHPMDVFFTLESTFAGRRFERANTRPSLDRIFRWLQPDANFGDDPSRGRGIDFGLRLEEFELDRDAKKFNFVITDEIMWVYVLIQEHLADGSKRTVLETSVHKEERLFQRGKVALDPKALRLSLNSGQQYSVRIAGARSSYAWSAPVEWSGVWP